MQGKKESRKEKSKNSEKYIQKLIVMNFVGFVIFLSLIFSFSVVLDVPGGFRKVQEAGRIFYIFCWKIALVPCTIQEMLLVGA